MNDRDDREKRTTPAMFTGLAAFILAMILCIFQPQWSAVPLGIFIFLCLTAPFFPTGRFFLPVVSRGSTGRSAVSLTFDDGPDPETTGPLMHLLERHGIKAAFFVTGENVHNHGNLLATILEHGHDIGNHSYHHDPFLMLRSRGTLEREIASTQNVLHPFGVSPLAFRPPVGITNPKLAPVLRKQGLYCLNFSCRANDFGNRRLNGLSGKILGKVKPDDIILLHDTRPSKRNGVETWLHEVDQLIQGLKNHGLEVIPLAELIRQPVMTRIT
jgi:peptidoglycan-N-acetylglucosamine deacetylase